MAITGISEFTFGFAFLFEQVYQNWPDLIAAPILPSLQQEAEEGWDARLPLRGVDFYFQFKLSDYLWNGNAKYIRDGTYDSPYYRIALHRHNHNQQHQRLRQLSKTNRNTFYVAPEFSQLEEFNTSYLSRAISQSSRLIPISECQDIRDNQQHFITYQPGDMSWTEWSKPKHHSYSGSGKNLESLYRRASENFKPVNLRFAEELYEKTKIQVSKDLSKESRKQKLEVIDLPIEEMLKQEPKRTKQALLAQTAELVSTYYGATMVLVGTKQRA